MTVLFYAKIQQGQGGKTDVENGNCCSCVACYWAILALVILFSKNNEEGILFEGNILLDVRPFKKKL